MYHLGTFTYQQISRMEADVRSAKEAQEERVRGVAGKAEQLKAEVCRYCGEQCCMLAFLIIQQDPYQKVDGCSSGPPF